MVRPERPRGGFLFGMGLSLALLLSPSPSAAAGDGETVISGDLGKRLDATVAEATGGSFWGAVLVARGEEVLLSKGYGFADYDGRPNAPDTLFELASVSKSFTAAAILRLEMERRLTLDDTLEKFFRRVPKDKQAITLRHLLTHTSGLSQKSGVAYQSTMTRDQYVEHVFAQPMDSAPGEKFAYNNAAYALLAAVVEVASKRDFEGWCREKLFRPAGLRDTGFIGDRRLDAKRASVRRGDRMPDGTAVDWHWGWGYRGMGGVVTTIEDLLLWDRALRGEKVLDTARKEEWTTPFLEGYALGWKVETTPRGTRKVHHSGGVHGFATNLARFPEEEVVIAVLSNGKSDLFAIEARFEDLLFAPPPVSLTVDLGNRPLDDLGAVQFDGTATWRVRRAGEWVELILEEAKTQPPFAVLRLPAAYARKVLADLRSLTPPEGKEPVGAPAGMHAGLYLRPYRLEKGRLERDADLDVAVMPRYSGRSADGEPVVDERVNFIVRDRKYGQWPVMVKMDPVSARGLAEGIRRALD